MNIKKLVLAILLGFLPGLLLAQTDNEKAIKNACFDYIDAFYKADTSLAYRSIHPKLQKRGFAYSQQNKSYSNQLEMPFPALIKLAKSWNVKGDRANERSARAVKVLDIEDKTASAKVTAAWGIDYIHLVKEDGRWLVMNVLWQSLPPKDQNHG